MVVSSITKSIEEDTQRAAAEIQLQKFGQFFEEYSNNLNRIKERLLPYSANPSNCVISINFQAEEDCVATNLINCDNKVINKILTVFSALCSDVSRLQLELKEKYVNVILYYGEGLPDDSSYEDCQLLVSHLLPSLQNISNFVKHCETVILEILWQLSAFYDMKLEICNVNLYDVFSCLGDVLIILIIIQEIIANNNTLIYHWSLYRRTIQLASHSASELKYDSRRIRQLDMLAETLEAQLLSKKIFENVLSLPFNKKIPVTKNKKLSEEFIAYLKHLVSNLEKNTNHETLENITKWSQALIMFALYGNLFGNYDKKFLKRLSDTARKLPLITLYENVILRVDTFLLTYIGHLLKPNERKIFLKENNCQQYLSESTQKMNNEVPFHAVQVLSWVLKIEEKMKQDYGNLKNEHLKDICSLLFDGIHYSSYIKMILSTVSNLYISMKKPMTKISAMSFCKLVEILKCIEFTYARHRITLAKLINYAVQYIEYECLNVITDIKVELTKDKNLKEGKIDTVSSLVIAEDTLNGPTTQLRLLIARLCLNLAGQMQCFTDPDRQRLPKILDKLSVISSLQKKLGTTSQCLFMYWNKGILPIYFEEINVKKLNINRINYLMNALIDGHTNFNFESREFSSQNFQANVNDETTHEMIIHIINPLCQKIEENLRLHVLQHLQIDNKTLNGQNFELTNLYDIKPFYFSDRYINAKWIIENYLNKTFYDLTTVALHNWQIYGEMRVLASQKFKLQTIDDYLPNQSLEQGLDLLEITRNVHTFVSSYFYNLNNQIFIEINSNNKHLNTINIRHISNSIRTHGIGVMSTAVNYTYQYLRQKLNVLSQFLYDEQIKSRLLKDISIFKEQADQLNPKYPFERAERFNRGIQKLGTISDGSTYLDQLKDLVTHIGNALGYVRMIRSAGLHCCSNATQFIPNLKKIVNFENLCREENLSETTCEAANSLDNFIHCMSTNITESANYFKLLVDVFSSVLTDPKNNHLKNFYIIVPPLTINFVEYIITAKESMIKKNKTNASFTDDGFAMGIAYILQVLNLYHNFDSLHWFQSVQDRNNTTIENLTKQIAVAAKDDIKLQHTLNLSLKRLRVFQKEFTLLYYNLYSARVLFENRNIHEKEGV